MSSIATDLSSLCEIYSSSSGEQSFTLDTVTDSKLEVYT